MANKLKLSELFSGFFLVQRIVENLLAIVLYFVRKCVPGKLCMCENLYGYIIGEIALTCYFKLTIMRNVRHLIQHANDWKAFIAQFQPAFIRRT